ncbi:hypothetical protein C5167_015064 [Papaver somniferum]|uniref:PIPK domain-containing protein n=1 Tax=Papaver somniferum TaxID=3469 RepID=A0A4Y7J5V6_PAPSO|nr:hypothetical protein C5167_015064 [Papaver somniferum]
MFVMTKDERLIVKQIHKIEFDSFMECAPRYFGYISKCLSSSHHSCLAKILGIYKVTERQGERRKNRECLLIVMENILFGRNVVRSYDLKGTQFSRYTPNADGREVGLDGNYVEDNHISPLLLSINSKQDLLQAILADTQFLASINVMDYSLLLGVDDQKK